jgi:hypothetical protein
VRYKSRLLGDECAGECVAYKVFEADVLYDGALAFVRACMLLCRGLFNQWALT